LLPLATVFRGAQKPPRATPAAFLFRIVTLPWEMAVVEDFLQVSCENRGTRIVMTGKQAPLQPSSRIFVKKSFVAIAPAFVVTSVTGQAR